MAQFLFLLYWVLKSFYTGASGGLQIGDFVFCASFAVFAVQNAHKLVKFDGPSELLKKDRLLGLFIAFVAFINVAYWIYYGDTGLLLAVAYFVFNRYICTNLRRACCRRVSGEFIIFFESVY